MWLGVWGEYQPHVKMVRADFELNCCNIKLATLQGVILLRLSNV